MSALAEQKPTIKTLISAPVLSATAFGTLHFVPSPSLDGRVTGADVAHGRPQSRLVRLHGLVFG